MKSIRWKGVSALNVPGERQKNLTDTNQYDGVPFSLSRIDGPQKTKASHGVAILALNQQLLDEDFVAAVRPSIASMRLDAHELEPAISVSIRPVANAQSLLRSVASATEDYAVFSPRPGLIWDRQLMVRVEREIADMEAFGCPWFCLSADGMDFEGRNYCAAYFNFEPTLLPDRGVRPIIQTSGTIFVVKLSSFRALGLRRIVAIDLVAFMNDLISVAYSRGLGSFFTSGLYPCLSEHRCLSYDSIDDFLAKFNPLALLPPSEAFELFPHGVSRRSLLQSWLEVINSACAVKHKFSFVVRTLFRRNHLLRRCLISIDYIRLSLGLDVEIIIASDVDPDVVAAGLRELAVEFPFLTFVAADGNSEEGRSRVRNLIAGIRATTGTRVCIVDDDDYYTPQAVGSFQKACDFGVESLVIFDTQIIVEKWLHLGVKPHREVTAYGDLYAAKSWMATLQGTNSIPLCGVIHPGWFVRTVVNEYKFDHDYSEDFIFHLHCFAHPKRPPVKLIESIVCAYQSHRYECDNVSNIKDRRRWVLDTGNGLYDLLIEKGRTFEVASTSEAVIGDLGTNERILALEAELARSKEACLAATKAMAALISQVVQKA